MEINDRRHKWGCWRELELPLFLWGGGVRASHFCRIISNFLLRYDDQFIRKFLYKTSIDCVSNESVGFCCIRDQFKKQESDTCLILQTTPDILARHVQIQSFWVVVSVILFCGLANFSYQSSVEVSFVTMPSKRAMESFWGGFY